MASAAEKLSFQYQAETCPEVANVVSEFVCNELDDFIDRLKRASAYKLRGALESACGDLLESREEIDRLKDEVETLKDTIDDLRSQIRELEREVA
ncbi:hypothetical protein ACYX7E_10120 [Luteimonas sp. RIT-PG2_3]